MEIMGILRWVAWNTFLALIPVGLGYAIPSIAGYAWSRGRIAARVMCVAVLLIWLAFLPNTCYLLTEWRHFLEMLNITPWHTRWLVARDREAIFWILGYSLFFLSYSLVGLFTFTLAIRPVYHWMRQRISRCWMLGYLLFPLVSLGVYLGLVCRYNSWDLVSRPDVVISTVCGLLSRPLLLTAIVLFATCLWFAYWIIDIWVDGFRLRINSNADSNRRITADCS